MDPCSGPVEVACSIFIRSNKSKGQTFVCPFDLSMGYKKDIFGTFAYEFELLQFLSEAQGFTSRDAMLSHRDVAHFVRSDVMFGATRPKACITDRRSASRTQCASLARKGKHR